MTTNANTVPPGWHPDPSNPGGALRWWDGIAWTTHTREGVPSAPQAAAPAAAWPGSGVTIAPNYGTANYGSASYASASAGGASYGGATYAPAPRTFAQRNRHSLTAIGFVALYVLVAMTTRFVVIGIVPVMLSIRAIKAKETLAPAAVAAAIIAVVVAFSALS